MRDGDQQGTDIDAQTSTGSLAANWSGFSDRGSGLERYEWAIGTTPKAVDVRGWQAVGLSQVAVAPGLALRLGRIYYVSVRAWDKAGNVSPVASSDGVTIESVGGRRTLLSQYGITWTLDREYETGRFVTGDWWVIGPVRIVGIDPPSTRVEGRPSWSDLVNGRSPGSSYVNGSMLNPMGGKLSLGYDSATGYTAYSHSKNVAYGVSQIDPLVLRPNSSLVSSISRSEPGARPQLQSQAVLTVLSQAPPKGSFRPPYCGTDKKVRFNESQLNYSLLRSLPTVENTPDLATVERWFQRPWVDHQGTWSGGRSHALANMPEYGRDSSSRVSVAAAMLHLKFTRAQKRELLLGLVQVGIDTFGVVQNGGEKNWPGNGGTGHGRKWPILFAGLMLDDREMSAIGSRKDVYFGEDFQTFFVAETSPGVYNWGHGGYTKQHVGMPEWGMSHRTEPERDDVRWTGSTTLAYRQCCTANAWGFVLAARLMNAQKLWDHDALFDYYDRYMDMTLLLHGKYSNLRAWHAFNAAMYDAYR